MEYHFNHGGKLCREFIISPENRAFRYGDGFFESMRMFEGYIPNFSRHCRRIEDAAKVFGFSERRDRTFWEEEIRKLTDRFPKAKQNFRIRLQIWRSDGGLYTPESDKTDFLIEISSAAPRFAPLPTAKRFIIFDEMKITPSPYSAFKTCNSLVYVTAARSCKLQQSDDCLILNTEGRIAETLSGNFFALMKDGSCLTPSLSEGCIRGVMRENLFELAGEIGLEIAESELSVSDLASADELFASNSTQGIWPLILSEHTKASDKSFRNDHQKAGQVSRKLQALLIEKTRASVL